MLSSSNSYTILNSTGICFTQVKVAGWEITHLDLSLRLTLHNGVNRSLKRSDKKPSGRGDSPPALGCFFYFSSAFHSLVESFFHSPSDTTADPGKPSLPRATFIRRVAGLLAPVRPRGSIFAFNSNGNVNVTSPSSSISYGADAVTVPVPSMSSVTPFT